MPTHSHRADKQQRTKKATFSYPPRSSAPGRRRAQPPRRRRAVSASSMVGGVALLMAAAGAVSAGQAMSTDVEASPTAADGHGRYVVKASGPSVAPSLKGRRDTQVSRSASRPTLAASPALQNAAERQAAARKDSLQAAADDAESYARELESDEWVMPTSNFHISVWFGEAGSYWSSGYHTGVDFAAPYGTPVVAVTDGAIAETGYDSAYGNYIDLKLDNGDEVTYNHLSSVDVSTGQTVSKGEQLGGVGDTGNAFGYHLHFEYRKASDLDTGVDPVPYLAAHGLPLR